MVFLAVGVAPVVKVNREAFEVFGSSSGNIVNKLAWRYASFLRRNHDRRAVRVVSTHKVHLMPAHALEAYPNIGLNVFHDVANMEVAVGIRQRRGDKQFALGWRCNLRNRRWYWRCGGRGHCENFYAGKPVF